MTRVEKVNSRIFLEGFLGMLSTFGPFVMDMYLASFPEIAAFYRTTPSLVQMSLASCTVGLAAGQFVFGIVSDRYGRRIPLQLSLLLFLAVSMGCLFSPTIALFVCMRFLQGLAAAGAVVISRSIAADCYSGEALARMFGIIGMINGVSTVLSPMLGGFVIGAYGWKSVFITLFVIGLMMLAGTVWLKESLPQRNRISLNWMSLFNDVRRIARNGGYIIPTMQYGFVMAVIFVNLASGPFIMNGYGFSAEQISLTFGGNAIALGIAAGLVSRFKDMRTVVCCSNTGMVMASMLLAATLLLHLSFWAYEAAVFLLYLFVGALCTATTTLAMDSERRNAGIASAFFGATGYVAGGIVSPVVGIGNIYVTAAVLFVGLTSGNAVLTQILDGTIRKYYKTAGQ